MPSLGSHLSPNNGSLQQTFADMHDVHYAPNVSNMSNVSNLNFPVNATVHHSNYNLMDRPLDGPSFTGTMTSQGPPGMSVFLSFCLSVYLSICLSVPLFVCSSVRQSFKLLVCLFCLSFFLSFFM
jgi:hypothetical protein